MKTGLLRLTPSMQAVRREDIELFEDHYAKHVVTYVGHKATSLPSDEVTTHRPTVQERMAWQLAYGPETPYPSNWVLGDEVPMFLRRQAE